VTYAIGDSHDGHDHASGFPEGGYLEGQFPPPMYITAPPRGFSGLVLRMYERTPTWGAPAAILACFLGAASYVWISNPTNGGAYDMPTCIVKLTTGLDCPGCGGTRAFYYLMQGNLSQAVRYHAPAVFAAPFLIWIYVAWAVKRIWGKKIPYPTVGPRTLSIFLFAWAVFAVVRNLPFAPFTNLYV
jgi:hypothetical protein